jgi:hypothetical protein
MANYSDRYFSSGLRKKDAERDWRLYASWTDTFMEKIVITDRVPAVRQSLSRRIL